MNESLRLTNPTMTTDDVAEAMSSGGSFVADVVKKMFALNSAKTFQQMDTLDKLGIYGYQIYQIWLNCHDDMQVWDATIKRLAEKLSDKSSGKPGFSVT